MKHTTDLERLKALGMDIHLCSGVGGPQVFTFLPILLPFYSDFLLSVLFSLSHSHL